jgi:hypothetical protein
MLPTNITAEKVMGYDQHLPILSALPDGLNGCAGLVMGLFDSWLPHYQFDYNALAQCYIFMALSRKGTSYFGFIYHKKMVFGSYRIILWCWTGIQRRWQLSLPAEWAHWLNTTQLIFCWTIKITGPADIYGVHVEGRMSRAAGKNGTLVPQQRWPKHGRTYPRAW